MAEEQKSTSREPKFGLAEWQKIARERGHQGPLARGDSSFNEPPEDTLWTPARMKRLAEEAGKFPICFQVDYENENGLLCRDLAPLDQILYPPCPPWAWLWETSVKDGPVRLTFLSPGLQAGAPRVTRSDRR
jgi:hypothetical protein